MIDADLYEQAQALAAERGIGIERAMVELQRTNVAMNRTRRATDGLESLAAGFADLDIAAATASAALTTFGEAYANQPLSD